MLHLRRGLATVEAAGKHVPWGGLGSGTYTAATKGCFDVIARCQPLVQAALSKALTAREAAGTANTTPFSIADFGTADGGTSLPLMRSIVAAVRAAEPNAPIVVHYEVCFLENIMRWSSMLVNHALTRFSPVAALAGPSCKRLAERLQARARRPSRWPRDVHGRRVRQHIRSCERLILLQAVLPAGVDRPRLLRDGYALADEHACWRHPRCAALCCVPRRPH